MQETGLLSVPTLGFGEWKDYRRVLITQIGHCITQLGVTMLLENDCGLAFFLPMGFEAENFPFIRGIALSYSDCSIIKSRIVGQKTKQRIRE